MREFQKSVKLENVSYDVRGPVLEEAERMMEEGVKILKLNTEGTQRRLIFMHRMKSFVI